MRRFACMTLTARIVLPGAPHHVTQRDNRRERIFFGDEDYALYRDWLAESCAKFGVEVWAYDLPGHDTDCAVELLVRTASATYE